MSRSDSKSGDFTAMVVGDFWPIFKKWWSLFKVVEKVLLSHFLSPEFPHSTLTHASVQHYL